MPPVDFTVDAQVSLLHDAAPPRAGEIVWWRGPPWESLHAGNAARPEVVVEGHLHVSESWATVWDDESGETEGRLG